MRKPKEGWNSYDYGKEKISHSPKTVQLKKSVPELEFMSMWLHGQCLAFILHYHHVGYHAYESVKLVTSKMFILT